MTDSTAIYCTLAPEELRARRSLVRTTIVPQVVTVTSLPDGLRLDFGPSVGLRDLVLNSRLPDTRSGGLIRPFFS